MESEKQLLMERLPRSQDQRESDSDATSLDDTRELAWTCGGEPDVTSAKESAARRTAGRKLLVALAISLIFMIGEVVGGYVAHSLAIMTDAAHLLTDVGSIGVSVFSLWISGRPPSPTMTFGWHRAEILGMLLSLVSVWTVTVALVLSAVQRIADGGGGYDIDGDVMLLTSGCAVAANVLMVVILHQSGVGHGHGHGHGHDNASVKAAFIHALGDLVQSLGVLLAAAVIHVWPEYKAADPACTLLFSLLVVCTTLPTARDVFRVLMEGAPPHVDHATVRDLLLSVPGVVSLHGLHVWSLNITHCSLGVHLAAEDGVDPHVIITTATQLLRSQYHFTSVTIQVEGRSVVTHLIEDSVV
ncbi:proton-coupled zinc antiporter SLC30A2-like [Nerophis lumbriciformis]|uniref:proton-coupled zinc antiporter SLC30A2-like n=1 Tax=Nerophis lumbriciformis TaxID=546530 RepID=UPI002ADF0751|nr:proton-coupled zinc antiporter SLC30A2-like [Nerophis lumbriciformis]